MWSGKLTVQEEEILNQQSQITRFYNPILAGSNNKISRVQGAKIGVVTKIASAFGQGDLGPPAMSHRGWISSTSTLREHNPGLIYVSCDVLNTRDAIWETLTMSLLAEENMSPQTVRSCFESLWRPDGRGAVEDVDLIRWIDDNAWFKVGLWTLREWSQVYRITSGSDGSGGLKFFPSKFKKAKPLPQNTKNHSAKQLDQFIRVLHRVLSSGMRLACTTSTQFPVAMVHLDVKIDDEIFFLKGCSVLVVLRKCSGVYDDRYRIIGGAFSRDSRVPNSTRRFELQSWPLWSEQLPLGEISLC